MLLDLPVKKRCNTSFMRAGFHMIQNSDFTLIISGSDYHLLPVGQALASGYRGIRITKSGALIWSLFSRNTSIENAIDKYINESDIDAEYITEAAEDARCFINELSGKGLLLESGSDKSENCKSDICNSDDVESATVKSAPSPCPDMSSLLSTDLPLCSNLSIAGTFIALYGPDDIFDKKLLSFSLKDSEEMCPGQKPKSAGQSFYIHFDKNIEKYIPQIEQSEAFIRNNYIDIYKYSDSLVFVYRGSTQLYLAVMDSDFKAVHIFCKGTLRKGILYKSKINKQAALKEELFHAIRMPFLLFAKRYGVYAIHSASVLYKKNNKAILFSAPSGTGKSTHARLWTTGNYATDINGDVNLIGMDNSKPVVYGTPWCGTSEIYTTKSHELGAICFLKRSPENHVEPLNKSDGLISLSRRCITFMLSADDLKQFFADMDALGDSAILCRLFCNMDPEAQRVLQEFIS